MKSEENNLSEINPIEIRDSFTRKAKKTLGISDDENLSQADGVYGFGEGTIHLDGHFTHSELSAFAWLLQVRNAEFNQQD